MARPIASCFSPELSQFSREKKNVFQKFLDINRNVLNCTNTSATKTRFL